MKGLPRSLSRGNAAKNAAVKRTVKLSGTVAVSSTGTAVGFGSLVVGDLPEGNILLLGAVANVKLAGSGADANLGDTWNGDFAIGSTATADVTLDGTDVDIIPSTAIGPAVAEVSPITRGANATQVILNNTDGSLELNLNVLVDAADIVDDQSVNLTVSGELYLCYVVLGDD